MERIDTHQHLLLPGTFNYPWVSDFEPLQGRFGLEKYGAAAKGCSISGSIFMEVDVEEGQIADEARYFCRLSEDPANRIQGVIAGGRPEGPDFQKHLDNIAHASLKGIRRVLHVVPDELSEAPDFRSHVATLGKQNLTFDICVRADQLAMATALADACPDTQFILDHCGGPAIDKAAFESWKEAIEEIARRDNVAAKISGIPASAPSGMADARTLRPWVENTIEAFGWDRVLWGGDWPVCTLNGTLLDWCRTLDEILVSESTQNRQKLFNSNAQRIYRL